MSDGVSVGFTSVSVQWIATAKGHHKVFILVLHEGRGAGGADLKGRVEDEQQVAHGTVAPPAALAIVTEHNAVLFSSVLSTH